jgi:hypothetical protein
MDHCGPVMVPGRTESGQWVRWRVGRRRLAWVPSMGVVQFMEFADGPFFLVVAVPVLALVVGEWLGALLAMAVVWPARAISGRWPVVAYRLDHDGDNELRIVRVEGRAAADSLVQQWAADIARQGRPGGASG